MQKQTETLEVISHEYSIIYYLDCSYIGPGPNEEIFKIKIFSHIYLKHLFFFP